MADQFCLRWNNFQTNIVNALDSLKCSEDLVDVTLTCEGKNIKAHKVILSACSPYFRNVFKENPCQHPVIILKDVLAEDIISLLSYMYQGEVFIEECKLASFLHTAALLQVKGLTGVTQQKETFTTSNPSNKLFNQLVISPKSQQNKPCTLKKRRNSTSDKPNDITLANVYKRGKVVESSDIYNNLPHLAKVVDHQIVTPENNNVEKNTGKMEKPITTNGGSSSSHINAQADNIPITIKTERMDDSASSPQQNNDYDNIPDYENSMLARSLLSGKNPSKTDNSASLTAMKKKADMPTPARPKEMIATDNTTTNMSPLKIITTDDPPVKSERQSPAHDHDYEPEILLSEQQDTNDTDVTFAQEPSQAMLLLAGMSAPPGHTGASTSQGISHQQSNHAAICGDCPHCGMKYSNQSALKYHVRLMHSDLTNRLCCYLCPRSFTMRETFKEHMWTTHGQRN